MINPKIIQETIAKRKPYLGNNSTMFLERVFADGIDKYERRLLQYGFSGYKCVLDAGCGFGQWSISLSQLNDEVKAVDISQKRVEFLESLAQELQINNVQGDCSRLDSLPYGNDTFDAIFCYGVIFLTRWQESLQELCRVLRPEGKLYLNANGIGWYKHLWYSQPNKATDYDPKLQAARAFYNTWKYESGQHSEDGVDIIIEPKVLKDKLRNLGFSNIVMDSEGCLGTNNQDGSTLTPFFRGEYLGDLGVYEIMAIKS